MQLFIEKVFAAIFIWIVIFGFGLLPMKLKTTNPNSILISLGNAFSGGLFLALGLIHILPEASTNMTKSFEKSNTWARFPFAFIISFLVFSLLLFIDKIMYNTADMVTQNKHHKNEILKIRKKELSKGKNTSTKSISSFVHMKKKHFDDILDLEELEIKEYISTNNKMIYVIRFFLKPCDKPSKSREEDLDKNVENIPAKSDLENKEKPNSSESIQEKQSLQISSLRNEQLDDKKKTLDIKMSEDLTEKKTDYDKLRIDVDFEQFENLNECYPNNEDDGEAQHLLAGDKHLSAEFPVGHHHIVVDEKSFVSAVIVLVSIGIHGLFCGLVIGISRNSRDLFFLILVMILHKWSEAITVGLSILKTKLPKAKCLQMIFLFSIFLPLGIFIGMFIPSSNLFVVGICYAIAAGTFIYISTLELLAEEFSIGKQKALKFIAYMVGFLLILGLCLLECLYPIEE